MFFFNLKFLAKLQAAVLFLLILYSFKLYQELKTKRAELKSAQVSLEHPKVIEKVRTIKVKGPTKIITKIIEKPGEKQTNIEESTEPSTETTNTDYESVPVPIDLLVGNKPLRSNRYLLTLGVNRLTYDLDGKAFLGGYSINNRIDIQAGIIKKEVTTPWIFLTFRI